MTRAEERAIRQQRRASKRQERERRRAEREARLARRENAKQGAGVVAQNDNEPRYFALREYHPWAFCEVGHHAVRENLMHDESCCIDCAAGGPIKAHADSCGSNKSSQENESRDADNRDKERVPEGMRATAREAGTAPARAPDGAGLPLEREQGTDRKTLAGQLLLEI